METLAIASSKTSRPLAAARHYRVILSPGSPPPSHADLQALQTLLGILAFALGIIMVVLSVLVKTRVFDPLGELLSPRGRRYSAHPGGVIQTSFVLIIAIIAIF
jgi:hypothetical protein